jgi:hypothetical protein
MERIPACGEEARGLKMGGRAARRVGYHSNHRVDPTTSGFVSSLWNADVAARSGTLEIAAGSADQRIRCS